MNGELTWEQEQDIRDYEEWLIEQEWERSLARMLEEAELSLLYAEDDWGVTEDE